MTTYQRLDKVAHELRDIINNDNDGPRLIANMVVDLPINLPSPEDFDDLERRLDALGSENEELRAEISDLENEISDLEDEIELAKLKA